MPRPVTEEDVWRRITQAFPCTGKNALGLPLDDDAALLTPRAGQQTILTCDWFLEGTHFLRDRPTRSPRLTPTAVWKALCVPPLRPLHNPHIRQMPVLDL